MPCKSRVPKRKGVSLPSAVQESDPVPPVGPQAFPKRRRPCERLEGSHRGGFAEQAWRVQPFVLLSQKLLRSPPKCADYVGPVTVEMFESKYGAGSGQAGLVTTTSLRPRDLLLVSNPVAIARAEVVEFNLIPATRQMNDASQEDLVTQLYNFARVVPRAFHQLQSLYNGSNNCTLPSIDLFVPGSTFRPPKTSPNSMNKLGIAPAQPDITSIRNVVQWNAYGEQGSRQEAAAVEKA
ncbi:hypothetical protein Mapa_016492 [Marchantia paleacea]|nr:hypothetical protein Mapa_016492 [Marchantia paleacea]